MPSLSKTLLPEEKFPVSIKLLLLLQAGSVFSKDAAQLANPQTPFFDGSPPVGPYLPTRAGADANGGVSFLGRRRIHGFGRVLNATHFPLFWNLSIQVDTSTAKSVPRRSDYASGLVLSRSDMQSRLSQRGQRFRATKSPAHVAGQEQPQSSNDGCAKLHPTAKSSL